MKEQKKPSLISDRVFSDKHWERAGKQKDRPDREKILSLLKVLSEYCITDEARLVAGFRENSREGIADQIIALKPTWTERVGWLIDRGWVPPDQYKINIEEIEAKARLTVQTELALERDIIKQINEAKIEEAKKQQQIDDTKYYAEMMKVATDRISKEAKREERERIWAWGLLMCDDFDHTNIPLPNAMGGGTVKKNNRRRARCSRCWGTLLGKP